MAPKEPTSPVFSVDILHCRGHPKPGTRILSELRVASLEEDLDPVEGGYNCLCLSHGQFLFEDIPSRGNILHTPPGHQQVRFAIYSPNSAYSASSFVVLSYHHQ